MPPSSDLQDLELATLDAAPPFVQCVARTMQSYAWDEPECWPSQDQIARDIREQKDSPYPRCARESVNRAIAWMLKAGLVRIKDKRPGRWRNRQRWKHNVYELLFDFVVGVPTIKRIVSRAHNTRTKRAQRLANRPDHTNHVVGVSGKAGWCSCGWCRPDRGRFRGSSPLRQAMQRWRPTGPGWRDELARTLRKAGRDPDVAYELADRLTPLAAA